MRGGILQYVGDGCDAGDGLLGEHAEFQRKRAGEFAIEIYGAAAHAGDDAGVLDLGALQLDENDGLLGAEKIGQDAQDFEIKFFDLVAGEDGVGVALHSGVNVGKGNHDSRLLSG